MERVREGGCTLLEHGVLLAAKTARVGTSATSAMQEGSMALAQGTMHTPAHEKGVREPTTPITPALCTHTPGLC